jgi:two-component system OmpR family sensor kinase
MRRRPANAPPPSPADARLLRATARRTALQAAGLVAVVILVLVGITALLAVRDQQQEEEQQLTVAARQADDVRDPPPGVWLVLARAGHVDATPGIPPALLDALARLRDPSPPPGQERLAVLPVGQGYRVVTRAAPLGGSAVVQAALSETTGARERQRIGAVVAITGLAGLLLAGLAGLALGHRAVRPLGEALAVQRRFVADASHELRTPLTLLSTRAQVLERALTRSGAPERVVDDAHGVVEDARRLADALDDLLLAASPVRDQPEQETDLAVLASEVVESAQAHARATGVVLTAVGDPISVRCAPGAVRRALLALVDNAVTHSPPGGTVTVETRAAHRSAVIAVHDAGYGIDPQQAATIFDRFASGGQRSGPRHYGLGLALAREVADRHDGELRLARRAGPGTTFELVLPAVAKPGVGS